MIYIKRFLYLLFMATWSIVSAIIIFIAIITDAFVSMVDYIAHGKLTKDHADIKVCEWLEDVSNKFKPE